MGKIWSKKAKTTGELLETLEEKIKSIEAYTLSTQEKQKRLIGQFLVISIGLYVISFVVFYFLFFPPTWEKRVVYSTPLLIFPFVIFMIKRLVAWFFQRKVNKNSSQLKELRTEKKQLLEQVMDKETYKVALDLLHRFSEKPALLRTNPQQSDTPRTALKEARPGQTPLQQQQQRQLMTNRIDTQSRPTSQIVSPYGVRSPYTPYPVATRTPYLQQQQQQPRTPFPIIDQRSKGVVEKLVDYLVGDGPSNRFAMICKECAGHNGMALQEQYEYTAFKCAFCQTLNPARKQRPIAPRLEATPERRMTEQRRESSSGTSEEEKISGSDSDEAPKELPEETTTAQVTTDTETLENQEAVPEPKPDVEKKDD